MHKGLKRYIMAVLWGGGAGLAWLTAWLVLGVVTQSPRLREVFAATDFVHRWAFGFCQYLIDTEVLSVHDAFAVYFVLSMAYVVVGAGVGLVIRRVMDLVWWRT